MDRAPEHTRRRTTAEAIAVVRPAVVVVTQIPAQRAVQRGDTPEEALPKDHAPVFVEDRALQPLHKAVGPRMTRLDACLADAQADTGRGEGTVEFAPVVRQDASHGPARRAILWHQDVAEEAGGRRRA